MILKLIALLLLIKNALSANILALMVVASHSHHLWNSKYLEALAERGHTITYLGIDEYKNPPKNIRHLYVKGMYEELYKSAESIDFTELAKLGPFGSTLMLNTWDDMTATFLKESPDFKKHLKTIESEKYDLIVNDIGISTFLLGINEHFNNTTPMIGITAFGTPPWALDILGNPKFYATNPHFFLDFSNQMNFFQRAYNSLLFMTYSIGRYFYSRNQERHAKEVFGIDTNLDRAMDQFNIILINSNLATDHSFPIVPGLIPVGGLHIQEPKPLSKDLQNFLDKASHGAIYFSLGSNIQSSEIGIQKISMLVEAFRRLAPVKILWKWESEELPGRPENVKIGKWMPQNDILAHPNIRLFFTHSGMLSTQEAIYHGVPIVGMPFFLDQHVNVRKCVNKGIGEKLEFTELTTEKIVTTIRKVLDNPVYKKNCMTLSTIFKDYQNRPLERAIYWTEYAIKHKGAPHLRTSARDLKWYENWMIDVFFLFFTIISVALFVVYKILSFIASFFIGSNKSNKLKRN